MRHLLFAALLACALPAHAEFQALRLSAPIKLDGRLSDPAWARAAVKDQFYENLPEDKIAAPVRTEIRILYDDRNMYVGMRAFDPHPEQIRSAYARRDKTFADQDLLILFLDPTGAKKSAQWLRVNPHGSISDGTYSDLAGEDFSPDFDFEVATGRFEGGWTAEVRIPYTSLAYSDPAKAPWNLLVFRNMPRETRYRMTNTPMPKDTNCFMCFMEPIAGMHDLPSGLSWTATPQARIGRATAQEDGGPKTSSNAHDLSLDVKVRVDASTTVDATIHPDFSQLELDAPQLAGNTAFGLFFPEKRPFFLEGSDMYATPFKAIYTRSMTRPNWGLRYTRRTTESDVTILSVKDAGGGLVLMPGSYGTNYANQDFRSDATVARVDTRHGTWTLGGIFSDRTLNDGRGYNRLIGPDFTWSQDDGWRITGQLLGSDTTALPDASGRLVRGAAVGGHAVQLTSEAQNEHWYHFINVNSVSPGFRADNGFFTQVGYREIGSELRYKFGTTGPFSQLNLILFEDGQIAPDSTSIQHLDAFGVFMTGPRDSVINIQWHPHEKQRLTAGGPLFDKTHGTAFIEFTPGPLVSKVNAQLDVGEMVDVEAGRVGRGQTATVFARVRPYERLELEPNLSVSLVDGPQGRAYREQALALNGIYHFSPRDTLRLIAQHRHTQRDQAQYKHPVEKDSRSNVTSLVYTHTQGLGTNVYVGLTRSNDRQLAARYGLTQNEFFVKGSWQI